jgi:hypothetical protein
VQNQSQGDNRAIYPSSGHPESNNPTSSLAVLLCDFSLIISVLPQIDCGPLLL